MSNRYGFGSYFTYTPEEYARALRNFANRTVDPEVMKAARKAFRPIKGDAQGELAKRGLGRAVFGAKPRGSGYLFRTRVRKIGGSVIRATLDLKGIAALVDAGGKTAPHDIKPKLKRFLKLKDGGVRKQVRHPGSRVPAQPYADETVARHEGRFVGEIDTALQAAASKELG